MIMASLYNETGHIFYMCDFEKFHRRLSKKKAEKASKIKEKSLILIIGGSKSETSSIWCSSGDSNPGHPP